MQTHPQYDEVKFTLETLKSKGFVPVGYTDEDEGLITTTDIDTIVDYVCGLDECWVSVKHPADREIDLFLVLGNEPGVLVSDYTLPKTDEIEKLFDDTLEEITNHFQNSLFSDPPEYHGSFA